LIIFAKEDLPLSLRTGNNLANFPRLLTIGPKQLVLERLYACRRHHDQQPTTRLSRIAFKEFEIEHFLVDELHPVDDWQLVDLVVYVGLLHVAEILGMASDAEARHVSGAMAAVLLGEACRISIQGCHRFDSHVIGLFGALGCEDLGGFRPSFISFDKPFVEVHGRLGSQGLREQELVAGLPLIDLDILILVAHHVGNTANYGPWVHDALPSSDFRPCLRGAIIESPDCLPRYDLSFLIFHLKRNG